MNSQDRAFVRRGVSLGIWSLALVLVGSAIAAPVQVSLSVRSKRADDAKNTSTRVGDANYGQQTTTYTESGTSAMSLTMGIRNMGKEAQTLQLDWYFIGKPLDSKAPDFVADKGTKSVTVEGGTGTTLDAASKAVKFTKQTGRNVKVREGAEVTGYLVTIKSSNTVVALDASTPSLRKIATDEKKLQALLAASAPGEKKK